MSIPRALVDTSVLLAVCDLGRPDVAQRCTEFIESRRDLCLSTQVVREFAVAATAPIELGGLGLSTADALENIRRYLEFMPLLPSSRGEFRAWADLLQVHAVTGKRIHDANMVATALAHGLAQIITLDVSAFEGFNDTVAVIDPTRR